ARDGGARLGEHGVERARDLAAARGRHDAERAVLVAALDDRDPRLRRRAAVDGEDVVVAVLGKINREPRSVLEHLIEMADVARAHHEVDPGRALEDALPFLLRDAAADADLQLALALHLAQPAEAREDLLLGLVADRTGVEQDEPRLRLVVDAPVPAQPQIPRQPLAVELIHLAAPRFDEEGLHIFRSAVAKPPLSKAAALPPHSYTRRVVSSLR